MKNTEAINWLENWLDSVSERGYQPAFVALLVRLGYVVLHSTSHNSMELGKDVIAKAPDGQWYVFQLKGQPGGRFSMRHWHEHYNQLLQLCYTPFRDFSTGRIVNKFFPVLVTNGEVEESVQAAIDLFNQSVGARPAASLTIWNRGKLLELFSQTANTIWPHSTSAQIALLKGLVLDFRDEIEPEDLQALVSDLIGLAEMPLSKAAVLPRWVSGFIAVNILCSTYIEKGNFYESIRVKIYFYANVVSHNEIIGLKTPNYRRFISAVRNTIFSELSLFCAAAAQKYYNGVYINEDIFGEFPIYAPRRLLIQALYAIELLEKRDLADDSVHKLATDKIDYRYFTHEYMVPAFLCIFWAKELYKGSRQNDIELSRLESTILSMSCRGDLFGPYFSLEEVVMYSHRDFLGREDSELSDMISKGCSHFARVLLYILAKRNYKQTCKLLWPDLTNTLISEYIIDSPEVFGLYRTDRGINRNEYVGYPMNWDELQAEIRKTHPPILPRELKDDIPALLLFLLFFPFRATDSIVLHIDSSLTRTWY